MTDRNVKVLVEVTTQHEGVITIDEDDYRAWLGGGEDDPSSLYDYLRSGSDLDKILATAALLPGDVLLRELSDVEDA